MIKVFIGGSRHISKINIDIKKRIDNILEIEGKILVGDANGVDKNIQLYLLEKHYKNVIVFYVGNTCRNNIGNWKTKNIQCESNAKDFHFFASKDIAMSKEADYGLMVWDGKSKGTVNNTVNLLRERKKVLFFNYKQNNFLSLKTLEDLRGLLRTCETKTRDKLIIDLKITEFQNELSQTTFSYT